MTPREMAKLRVIDQTIAKNITVREAAELLNLSERQVLRLKKGVLEQGAAFVIHKNRGRKPEHTIFDSIKDEMVKLKQSELYQESNAGSVCLQAPQSEKGYFP
jgi:predicted DNA-binding transcriptional regulator YafY